MKLIRIARRGPDRELGVSIGISRGFGPDKKTSDFRIHFRDADYTSRYHVDLTRNDAMRLRDNLNNWFPETEFYDGTDTERAADFAWKDGEFAYCIALCESAGNIAVPPGSVAGYLRLQSKSAAQPHNGEIAISEALGTAAQILEDSPGRFSEAFRWLVKQREKIAAKNFDSVLESR